MALKRSPLDDPPAASSSEEEGTTSGGEEDVSEGGTSSEEEEEEEKVDSKLKKSAALPSAPASATDIKVTHMMEETPKRQKLLEKADMSVKSSGLPESVVKGWLELIDESKRAEFDEQWKKLHFAEFELFVRRTELVRDHARLMLEAYKSSNK